MNKLIDHIGYAIVLFIVTGVFDLVLQSAMDLRKMVYGCLALTVGRALYLEGLKPMFLRRRTASKGNPAG
jgi:hypothetical protein